MRYIRYNAKVLHEVHSQQELYEKASKNLIFEGINRVNGVRPFNSEQQKQTKRNISIEFSFVGGCVTHERPSSQRSQPYSCCRMEVNARASLHNFGAPQTQRMLHFFTIADKMR